MKKSLIHLRTAMCILILLHICLPAFSQTGIKSGVNRLNIDPPEFLEGTYSSSPDRIALTWLDFNSFSVEGYIIEREGSFGAFTEIARTSGTFYDDFSVSAGRSYTYRVKAFVGSDVSLPSFPVTVSTTLPLPPVGNLVATTDASEGTVDLAWSYSDLSVTTYRIMRSVNNGNLTTLKTVNSTGFSITTEDDQDLRRGNTYSYQVVAVSGSQTSPPSNVETVTIGKDFLNPASDVAASYIPADNLVRLSWTDDNGNETGFTVERATDGGTYSVIANITQTGTSISYDDNTVVNQNTYKYRIRTNAGTQTSSYSGEASVELDEDLVAPQNLTGTYDAANNRIILSWEDINSDETYFQVEKMIGFGNFEQIGTVTGNGSNFSFTDNAVSQNNIYRYRVRAMRPDDASPYSNTVSVSTVFVLDAPTNLATLYQASNNRVRLTWQDNNADETGFQIQRSVNNGAYTVIANLNTTGSNLVYNDTQISQGNTYRYRVRAAKANIFSPFSNIATSAIPTGVNAPGNLRATVLSSSAIRLNWNDNSNNETQFRVERAIGSGSYSRIATLGANTTTFTNTGLLPNTVYRYRVSAANSVNVSGYSNAVQIRTFNTVPNAPSGLTATFNAGTVAVDFNWTDNSNNDTGHEIQFRLQGTNTWETLQITIPGNATSASTSVSNVLGDRTFETRVRATNSVGPSAWSNIASVYLPPNPIPVAPANLTAAYLSASNEIRLNWWDMSDNESKFIIEFKVLNSQWSQLIHEPAANSNTITFSAPPCCYNYTFRIKAINNNGSSIWSNTASAFVSGSTASRNTEDTFVNAYPNPSKGKVTFTYDRTIYNGQVEIIDPVSGKVIRELTVSSKNLSAEDSEEILWDGRDRNGNMVRPGTYLFRISGSVGAYTGRLLRR